MLLNVAALPFGTILAIMFTFSFSYQKKNDDGINLLENVATHSTTSREFDEQ